MSVERWQMPSGRIATIDLNQPAEAVEEARRLLREFGDAELINEEAPGAVGAAAEGDDQNTNQQEGEPTMSSINQTTAVREWVNAFNTRRAELADEIQHEAGFQEWAAEQVKDGPWTYEDCVAKMVHHRQKSAVPFPLSACPSWVIRTEVDLVMGGEATVMLYGEVHRSGDVTARLTYGLSVVVGPNGVEDDDEFPEETLGTVHPFIGVPEVLIDGIDFRETVTDWRVVADAARALAGLAAQMQALAVEVL